MERDIYVFYVGCGAVDFLFPSLGTFVKRKLNYQI